MDVISSLTELRKAIDSKKRISRKHISCHIEELADILTTHDEDLTFYHCEFEGEVSFGKSLIKESLDLKFEDCIFHFGFSIEECKMKAKLRMHRCVLKGHTNFRNATFEGLADFWNTTFEKQAIFYKTDFKCTTVFSAATFEQNVLFTYSLIDKLVIFRGTHFEKGLDLSNAIIPGELSIFNITLGHYETVNIYEVHQKGQSKEERKAAYEEAYTKAVDIDGDIPVENRVETFRIIKQWLKNEGSSEAIEFNVKEKEAFRKSIEEPVQTFVYEPTLQKSEGQI